MSRTKYPLAFDWDWSDGFASESSRAIALSKRKIETGILETVCEANNLVHFALWHTLPPHHPVGELWLESETDLHASIYLAYGGYFRQALATSRSWLEIAVNGVYFSKYYKQQTSRYRQWRAGKRQAPADMRKIADSLGTRPNRLFPADANAIAQTLVPIYASLCHQVHGLGLDQYDLQNGRDNVPKFLEQSFDYWYKSVIQVFETICYLYRLFYTKEIASYLMITEAEEREMRKFSTKLKKDAPEFCLLASSATSRRR